MIAPDIAAIALLKANSAVNTATGGRISTDYLPGAASIRISVVGGSQAEQENWRAALQIECWAEDQIVAGQLAATVREAWPQLRGAVSGTRVIGCWLESNPAYVPDPDSDRPRYLLTVGLWLG